MTNENMIKKYLGVIFKVNDLLDRRERLQFVWVVFVILLMAIFEALSIGIVFPFTNLILDPGSVKDIIWLKPIYNSLTLVDINSFILLIGVFTLSIVIFSNLLSIYATWLRYKFIWGLSHRISVSLLNNYLTKPYSFFLNNNSSELSKNVLAEVQDLTLGLLTNLMGLFSGGLVSIIIFAFLIYINPLISLGTIGTLGILYLLAFLFFFKKLQTAGVERLRENKFRFKYATEALTGIKELKVLGREEYFLNKFSKSSKNFSDLTAWYQIVYRTPRYILELFAFGGTILSLLYIVLSGFDGSQAIPVIGFLGFAGYRLMPAMQEVFTSFTSLRFNKAILNKIHTDFYTPHPIKINNSIHENQIQMKFLKNIQINKLSFLYPNSKIESLKNINLVIPKKSSVAIVGATGSGKTTLIDLLLGLLSPTSGEVLIDGVPLTKKNLIHWQKNLGYVPQQIYLSDDSITNNIALGVDQQNINLDRVKIVSKIANLNSFIEALPLRYDTLVGERGVKLSGGQKQRIGLARALYHDPEILILDEATSALDSVTEKEVLKALNNISKRKTLIVIAHRLTTLKKFDKIFLLEKGKIISSGDFKSLAKTSKIFNEMVKSLEKE